MLLGFQIKITDVMNLKLIEVFLLLHHIIISVVYIFYSIHVQSHPSTEVSQVSVFLCYELHVSFDVPRNAFESSCEFAGRTAGRSPRGTPGLPTLCSCWPAHV